ncbi:MAG: ribonuclease P protein component [Actinomycetia bacterium]|nr:ribonuclease P protein component [Actinomycetes bacterium]
MLVERLRRRQEFAEAFARGRSYGDRLIVVFVLEGPEDRTAVGFAAARAAGGSVKRNRIRRRLRAAFAEVKDRVRPGRRVVILGKVGVLDAPWSEVCRSVRMVLKRAGCLQEEG